MGVWGWDELRDFSGDHGFYYGVWMRSHQHRRGTGCGSATR